jgi:hypothetical protein
MGFEEYRTDPLLFKARLLSLDFDASPDALMSFPADE